MTNDELFDLHKTLGEGILALHTAAIADVDGPAINHARVLFCALGRYLTDTGLLDQLASAGEHMVAGSSGLLHEDRGVSHDL
jgi:hypothetical protein